MTDTRQNVAGEHPGVGHIEEGNGEEAFPPGFTLREFFRQAVWNPGADAQRGEEEEITEENVYDSYDETIPFFPDQILIEGYFCVLLLLIVTALSYLEAVMNSIRNGLGMRETEIVKEPTRPWNPHFYAIFTQVHNTL